MTDRSNQKIIDDIFLRCSDRIDKQMYLFENILGEKETLSLLDDSLYFYVAGNILMLNPDGSDTSNNPELVIDKNKEKYEEERRVILKYLLTLIHFELGENHKEAYDDCVNLLETTTRTFSREFLNVLYLIILFDGDDLYKNLCRPLANFCVNILFNEFNKEKEIVQ